MMCDELDHHFFLLVKSDKKRAFQLVFDAYWSTLYKQAYRKVQCKDMAKDLTQDVFLLLWNKIDTLDSDGSILAYLYAVLRNKVLQLYQRNETAAKYALSLSTREKCNDSYEDDLLIEKELKGIIDDEVASMPPRMREIYLLKKDADISIKQIAGSLSLSEQTIKNQLQMAYQRLKNKAKAYDPSLVRLNFFLKKDN